MSFDKNALLAALKPKTKLVEIDGFGSINAKQLSVAEVNGIRDKLKKAGTSDYVFGLSLVVLSFVDEAGALIFSDDDIAELSAASNAAVDKLVSVALDLNGFKKTADEKN